MLLTTHSSHNSTDIREEYLKQLADFEGDGAIRLNPNRREWAELEQSVDSL